MTQRIAAHGQTEVDNACYHCGTRLAVCQGCGEERCLSCEPYLSDDCRWAL